MNLKVIGESATKLTDELKTQNPLIPWQKIKGFRNIAAHNYFGVDAEETWQIIKNHLPELLHNVEQILNN